MINNAYLNRVFADLQKNHPNEPEFLQAVDEVFDMIVTMDISVGLLL